MHAQGQPPAPHSPLNAAGWECSAAQHMQGVPITASTANVPGCMPRCTARVQLQPRHCLKRYKGCAGQQTPKTAPSSERPLHTHSQGSAAGPILHTATVSHMQLPRLLQSCSEGRPQARAAQHTRALAPQSGEQPPCQRTPTPPTCLPMHQPKEAPAKLPREYRTGLGALGRIVGPQQTTAVHA